jgi:hypothetical protein
MTKAFPYGVPSDVLNGNVYVLVILLGAFALALWVDARWPQLAPQDLGTAVLHVCASILVSRLLVSAALTVGQATPGMLLLMVVALIVPTVGYCLIAGIWLVKFALRGMSGLRY